MHESNPINKVLKFWPILAALFMGASALVGLFYEAKDHEKRLNVLEVERAERIKRILERERHR